MTAKLDRSCDLSSPKSSLGINVVSTTEIHNPATMKGDQPAATTWFLDNKAVRLTAELPSGDENSRIKPNHHLQLRLQFGWIKLPPYSVGFQANKRNLKDSHRKRNAILGGRVCKGIQHLGCGRKALLRSRRQPRHQTKGIGPLKTTPQPAGDQLLDH